jgi:Type III restriction enzyme, res subunit
LPSLPVEVIATSDTETRTRLRFSWAKVDPRVIRALLEKAYDDRPTDLQTLKKLSDVQLRSRAERSLGQPLKLRLVERCELADVLKDVWLPSATAVQVDQLLAMITIGRPDPGLRTKRDKIAYIRGRNRTKNLRVNLLKQFLHAHRARMPVRSVSLAKANASALRELRGQGTQRLGLYPHQKVARQHLDTLLAGANAEDRRGLLVLPTGAGKTYTVVGWLLDQLNADPSVRVLWVAHRRELLEQSAGSFVRFAKAQSSEFTAQLTCPAQRSGACHHVGCRGRHRDGSPNN